MKKLEKIVVTAGDTYIVTFKNPEECDGETVLADLYTIGTTDSYDRVSSSSTGDEKGEEISVTLDFTDIDAGAYGLKIWTAETGVLARGIVIVKAA